MSRRQLLIAGTVCVLSACSGGSSEVTLPAPTPGDPRCPALLAALPRDLGSLRARTTDPLSPSTRAWGTPAVTVVCGGARPSRVLDRDGLTIDGVDWSSPEEGADPTIYRTTDPGRPYVVVTLPHSVVPGVALGPLVDALRAEVSAGPSPSAPPR